MDAPRTVSPLGDLGSRSDRERRKERKRELKKAVKKAMRKEKRKFKKAISSNRAWEKDMEGMLRNIEIKIAAMKNMPNIITQPPRDKDGFIVLRRREK